MGDELKQYLVKGRFCGSWFSLIKAKNETHAASQAETLVGLDPVGAEAVTDSVEEREYAEPEV